MRLGANPLRNLSVPRGVRKYSCCERVVKCISTQLKIWSQESHSQLAHERKLNNNVHDNIGLECGMKIDCGPLSHL
jgi:hypothetical protein